MLISNKLHSFRNFVRQRYVFSTEDSEYNSLQMKMPKRFFRVVSRFSCVKMSRLRLFPIPQLCKSVPNDRFSCAEVSRIPDLVV